MRTLPWSRSLRQRTHPPGRSIRHTSTCLVPVVGGSACGGPDIPIRWTFHIDLANRPRALWGGPHGGSEFRNGVADSRALLLLSTHGRLHQRSDHMAVRSCGAALGVAAAITSRSGEVPTYPAITITWGANTAGVHERRGAPAVCRTRGVTAGPGRPGELDADACPGPHAEASTDAVTKMTARSPRARTPT